MQRSLGMILHLQIGIPSGDSTQKFSIRREMKSMSNIYCKLCNTENIQSLDGHNEFGAQLFYCNDCSFYFTSGIDQAKLTNFYSKEYFNDIINSDFRYFLKQIFSKMRALSQFKYIKNSVKINFNPTYSVLEIGAGDGTLLSFFKKINCEVEGLEFSKIMIDEAKVKYNIQLKPIDLFNLKADKRYDLITMSHAIEHFSNPVECLERCRSLLKNDGVIFLEVPNSPLPHTIEEKYLAEYLNTTHTVNFTNKSMAELLSLLSFRKYTIDNYLYNIPPLFINSRGKIIGNLMKGSFDRGVVVPTCISMVYLFLRYLLSKDTFQILKHNKDWMNERDFIRVICYN